MKVETVVLPPEVAAYVRVLESIASGATPEWPWRAWPTLEQIRAAGPGEHGHVQWGPGHPNEVVYTAGWAVCECGPAEDHEAEMCMSCGGRVPVRERARLWWAWLTDEERGAVERREGVVDPDDCAGAFEKYGPGRPPRLLAGDVVTAGRLRFGWFDGDEAWVAERKSAVGTDRVSHSGELFTPYYVVTLVDRDDRGQWRYHLRTRMFKRSYSCGYTYDQGHFRPEVAGDAPELPGASELVGRSAHCLL